jgi:hypothetical protein
MNDLRAGRTMHRASPRQDETCERIASLLLTCPTYSAKAVWVLDHLMAAGFTRDQIIKARPLVAMSTGFGRCAVWHLMRDQGPRMGSIAELRERFGLDRPRTVVHRRELCHCSSCGVHIGTPGPGEPMLCQKPSCREAA